MMAHCNDLTDKIAETKKWLTDYIDNRDGMPSLAPLVTPNEDKFDMIMMHLKNLEKEGSGKEDKGRQGEDKGKQGNTNNTPQNNIPSQSPTQEARQSTRTQQRAQRIGTAPSGEQSHPCPPSSAHAKSHGVLQHSLARSNSSPQPHWRPRGHAAPGRHNQEQR